MPNQSISAALIVMSLLGAGLIGCSPEGDLSMSSRFDDVRDKCFESKAELFIIYANTAEDYYISPPAGRDATSDMPLTAEDFRTHPEKYSPSTRPHVIGILPVGTRFKATRLAYERADGQFLPFGRILNGKYAGKMVGLWDLLDDPDAPNSPSAASGRIQAKPAYLRLAACP